MTLKAELSMGWVDPWVWLSGWSIFFDFWWVGSIIAKVLKFFERIMLMHLKHG